MLISLLRGATSCALFALFGLGSLMLAPAMLFLRRPERGQPFVRAAWRAAVSLFVGLRLIRLDCGKIPDPRGTIIIANHPSLIDVVLLTVLLPRTTYVAKHSLKHNLFLSAIVRATAVPDDASFLESAARLLSEGWNVLIFPEGTRTPRKGSVPYRRGAAQLALRTCAPILAVGLKLSQRILAKGQPPWEMGRDAVVYRIRFGVPTIERVGGGETFHTAAIRVTAALESRVKELLECA